jgi:beta-aspartyl-peptidase (threonine type)
VAREICARIEYLDQSVEKASSELIQELKERGADGGVIVLDANGNASMVFNTGGMARAYKNSKGDEIVTIY